MKKIKILGLRQLSAFGRDQQGVISVESVLWVPLFLVFLTMIADVSLMFHGQAKTMRIIQDANRLASTGILADTAAVEAQVIQRVNDFSANAAVESDFVSDAVVTTVTIPASDLAAVGFVGRLLQFDITVSSLHLVES